MAPRNSRSTGKSRSTGSDRKKSAAAPKKNTGRPATRKAGGRGTGAPRGAARAESRGAGGSRGGSARGSASSRDGGARIGAPGRKSPSAPKGLGGEQIEGRQAIRELLIGQKRKIKEIWFAADLDDAPIIADIEELAHAARVPVLEVPRRTLEEKARSEAPQGVLAFAAPIEEHPFGEMLKTKNGVKPFLVAIDGVTDPGNLGAILRCCDAAGVTGVLLPKHRAVHVTPTVAKASAGAVEHVPMTLVSGLPTAIGQMRDKGIWVVGLDDASGETLFDIGKLATDGICLVLGAEGAGLSRLVKERCDSVVGIPMMGQVSSLNVSAAAALAVYEVTRARAQQQPPLALRDTPG